MPSTSRERVARMTFDEQLDDATGFDPILKNELLEILRYYSDDIKSEVRQRMK